MTSVSSTSAAREDDSEALYALPQRLAEIEAMVFAAPSPVDDAEFLRNAGLPPSEVMAEIIRFYEGRGICPERTKDGWLFRPAGDIAAAAAAFHDGRRPRRISEAALATLAVIAIHQPVTIPEIEAARGVKLSRNVMESLVDAGLVMPGIRRSGAGRAITYVTTEAFLERFDLDALSDMPTAEEAEIMDLGEAEVEVCEGPDGDATAGDGGSAR